MIASVTVLKDTKLDQLAAEIVTLINDAEQAKVEATKKDKSLPWAVGALLAEARKEFLSDEQYGQWIVSTIIEKIVLTTLHKNTLTNYKNLVINFGHLLPEIQTFNVTALYGLNEWAKANPGMTLEAVKAKLSGKPKSAPKKPAYSWRKQAQKKGFSCTAGWDWDDLHADLTKHNSALTFKEDDDTNLQEALDYVYAIRNPEEVDQEAEEAKAQFIANSKVADKVKTIAQLEAKLKKQYEVAASKQLTEEVNKYKAKLEEEIKAKEKENWAYYQECLAKLEKDKAIVKEQQAVLHQARQEINFFMTKAEYKLILSCLHTDHEADQEKKTKALQIMLKFNKVFK